VEDFKYLEQIQQIKFYSGRNQEQIEVRKCLVSLGAKSFVFQVDIQKFKDQDI
jgi:hypothetical protein